MLVLVFVGVFAAVWVLTHRRRTKGRVKALCLITAPLVAVRVAFETLPAPLVALALAVFLAALIDGSRREGRRRTGDS